MTMILHKTIIINTHTHVGVKLEKVYKLFQVVFYDMVVL